MGQRGDFLQVLREQGYPVDNFSQSANGHGLSSHAELTTGTTVFAMKYADGVLVAGDRRATAGNVVMYDRTDKVLEIDRFSVLAIAGVPATAFEMARVLEHSFKYYRRSQLQDLSFEGKLRALSTLLKNNAPAALAGTGTVVPVFAGYDALEGCGKIFFYDILGAEFEAVEYAVSGSGSPTIRGILFYMNRWGTGPVADLNEEDALIFVLRLMTSAAEFDSATGGVDAQAQLYPIVKRISAEGVRTISSDRLKTLFSEKVINNV
ncbi:MAG: proteasome subunit alpha [Nitrospirales bacterium]